MPKRKYIYFLDVCWCGEIVYGNHRFCKGHYIRNKHLLHIYIESKDILIYNICMKCGVTIPKNKRRQNLCDSCYKHIWREEQAKINPDYYKQIYLKRKSKRDYYNKQKRDWAKKQRLDVISHYSNGSMSCNCCGEKHIEFLCIDHINNDGNEHRKTIGNKYNFAISSNTMYRWIIKNNYPNEFQVLCYNCNQGKYLNNGICPHKNKLKE